MSTTTTTVPPRHSVLKRVETYEIKQSIAKVEQDGSDNKGTLKTIDSTSLDLGPLSPGEISATKIIRLRVPNSLGIDNVKLALIDTGGIVYKNSTFGVETHSHLDYNIVPASYFGGVNSSKISDSVYNVSIPNSGALESQYVYLNVNLPQDHTFGGGSIRYKWFFDYQSGISST